MSTVKNHDKGGLSMEASYFRTAETLITGVGSIKEISKQVEKLNATNALIITDKVIQETGLLLQVTNKLEVPIDVMTIASPEPSFVDMEALLGQLINQHYDLLIGIGGGSVLDTAKILSVMLTNKENIRSFIGTDNIKQPGVATILIPTTAGTGSEVTNIAIFTDLQDNMKKGIVSPYLLPNVAIVDANLTLTVPPAVTAATGMDALVHAIEAYTSVNANMLTDSMAIQAIKLIGGAIRKAVHQGNDIKARADMAMGSLLAGIAFGNAGVGAVHALAYPLGGKYKIPHGVSNSLLLPYVMKYNVVANVEKFAEVAEALGENVREMSLRDAADQAIFSLTRLCKDIGIPRSLEEVGVSLEALPALAEEASKVERLLKNNPRTLSLEDIQKIYEEAYRG